MLPEPGVKNQGRNAPEARNATSQPVESSKLVMFPANATDFVVAVGGLGIWLVNRMVGLKEYPVRPT